MIGFRRVMVFLVQLLILASPCFAESSVRALFTLRETGEFAALTDIVFESVVLSLEERGINVITLPEGAEAPSPTAADVIFIGLAEIYGTDFILSAAYEVDGDSISVDFVWFDVSKKSPMVRETASGQIDLTLDKLLNDALKRVVDTSGDRIDELRAARRNAGAEGPVAGKPGEAPADGQPSETPSQSQNASVTTDTATESPAEPRDSTRQEIVPPQTGLTGDAAVSRPSKPKSPAELAPNNLLEISTGFRAFITVASQYSTIGYNPVINISYLFGLPRLSALDIGLESGVNMLQMRGLSLAASALIIPVGIHIGYLYMANDSVEISAGLSGGPAFFILKPAVDEDLGWKYKTKLMRYAAAGVGVLIHFSQRMGLHLVVGYDVYFEGSTVLMGFTPGVNLYYRL